MIIALVLALLVMQSKSVLVDWVGRVWDGRSALACAAGFLIVAGSLGVMRHDGFTSNAGFGVQTIADWAGTRLSSLDDPIVSDPLRLAGWKGV